MAYLFQTTALKSLAWIASKTPIHLGQWASLMIYTELGNAEKVEKLFSKFANKSETFKSALSNPKTYGELLGEAALNVVYKNRPGRVGTPAQYEAVLEIFLKQNYWNDTQQNKEIIHRALTGKGYHVCARLIEKLPLQKKEVHQLVNSLAMYWSLYEEERSNYQKSLVDLIKKYDVKMWEVSIESSLNPNKDDYSVWQIYAKSFSSSLLEDLLKGQDLNEVDFGVFFSRSLPISHQLMEEISSQIGLDEFLNRAFPGSFKKNGVELQLNYVSGYLAHNSFSKSLETYYKAKQMEGVRQELEDHTLTVSSSQPQPSQVSTPRRRL